MLALAQTGEAPAIYAYAGADRGERLIAKAREEGSLTLYTSIATTESTPLARAFESKYGVKVQLWRALSENVVQRALTESRGGSSDRQASANSPDVGGSERLCRWRSIRPYYVNSQKTGGAPSVRKSNLVSSFGSAASWDVIQAPLPRPLQTPSSSTPLAGLRCGEYE